MLPDPMGISAWPASMQAAVEKRAQGGPPSYSVGTYNPGPTFVDYSRTRRAPTPADLVESWRELCFGCSILNANAVGRQTLRLYVGTGHNQNRPKTFSYLRPRAVDRQRAKYLRSIPEFAPSTKAADEIDEVTEHPLLTLFGEVNPDWDHVRLIRYISLCLDIIGRGHVLPGDEQGVTTPGRKLPPFLWPLMGQYVIPYRDTEGSLVSHYYYFGREYEPSQLISFRGDSLRDPYAMGQSPTQAAFAFVGLSGAYVGMMETLLTQSVRPSVIVANKDADAPLGDVERRRLQNDINRQLSRGGAGLAWVVDGALDVKALNVPPTSLAENEISDTAIKYIAFIFGVPLSFIRNEDSNRAVAEAGHYQHAKLAVEPRCVNISSTLTKWTHAEGRRRGLDWSRLFWAFDNPVKEDEQREADIWAKDIANGSRTINERRLNLGYDARPYGDEPWLSNTLVQPSTAAAESKKKDEMAARQFQAQWGEGGDEQEGDEGDTGESDAGSAQPNSAAEAASAAQGDTGKAAGARRKALSSPEAAVLESASIKLAQLAAEAEEADGDDMDGGLESLEIDPTAGPGERMHDGGWGAKRNPSRRRPRPHAPEHDEHPNPGHAGGGSGHGGNPNHDAGGRFASGPGAGGAKPAKPRDFGAAGHEAAMAHHAGMSGDWAKSLPPDQHRAVKDYAAGDYAQINRHLRSGGGPGESGTGAVVHRIDSALAATHLSEPITVYRGIKDVGSLGLDTAHLAGATIHDRGFLSTSLSRDVATSFVEGGKGAVLKVSAPAGSHGASLAGATTYAHEAEVLFARGASLTVTKTSKDKQGRLVIHASLSYGRGAKGMVFEVKGGDGADRAASKFGWEPGDVEITLPGGKSVEWDELGDVEDDDWDDAELKHGGKRKPRQGRKPNQGGRNGGRQGGGGNAPGGHGSGHYDPDKHPRDAQGHYRETPDAPKPPPKPGKPGAAESSGKPKKRKATIGEMAPATRVGKGKDARIVMADGSPAPAHITPKMVPPDWTDVHVSVKPGADVLVKGRDSKGRAKNVYTESYETENSVLKFGRVRDMMHEERAIVAKVKQDQHSTDHLTRENADVTALIHRQGTRPGSEADTKSLAHLYGAKFGPENITGSVVPAKGKKGEETSQVKLRFEHGGKTVEVPIKDVRAAKQLLERKSSGKGLEDAKYWLQSHGATTLEGRHVVQSQDGVRLQFMGKESVWHDHLVRDPDIAAMLVQRKEAAGDKGQLFDTDERKLNRYVKQLGSGGYTPKDFRTMRGTNLAQERVNGHEPPKNAKEYKQKVMDVAEHASHVLGNKPKQALETYIHPAVFGGWGPF